ncbi:hypothetical protein [Thalassospira xiamenensis]|uniref:hypothetical protein n=1 Tax=Thalassospira xiamenensis TaxID=220697 RepID=UPI003AA96F47
MTDQNTDPAAGAAPAPDATTTTENTATAAPEQDGGLSLSLPEGDAAPAADPAKPEGEAPAIPEGYVKVPGEGATEAEVAAYRAALGVPETAEGYLEGFEVPEGYQPPAFLAEAALKAGVPKSAIQELLKADAEANEKAYADLKAAAEEELNDASAAFKTKYGKETAEALTKGQRFINEAGKKVPGLAELLKKTGLTQHGVFLDFAVEAGKLLGESAFVDGDGGKGGDKAPATLQEALYSKD